MKLFFCPECYSVKSLQKTARDCECGQSGGKYLDDLNAEIWGKAVALGFKNSSFIAALKTPGSEFVAFTINLKKCLTIKVISYAVE